MAFIEYILVALLGTSGAAASAGTPGGASTPTFNADSITQPNGGTVGPYVQKKPDKEAREDSGKKATRHSRYHKGGRHRRHRRHAESGKKAIK